MIKDTKFPSINNPENSIINNEKEKIVSVGKPKHPSMNYYQSRIAKSFDMK